MTETFRALTLPSYGSLDRFTVTTSPLPKPCNKQVRVRILASTLNPADLKVGTGAVKFLHGRKFPMTLGYDFSGVVEAVGHGNAKLKVGDEVFGFLPYGPFNNQGAFAEVLLAQVDEVAIKPKGVSHFQAAAAATSGVTSIQSLRDLGRLPSSGGRVLVTGASGGVGSIAIGVARRLGAAVDAIGSGAGLELARKLGAEETFDRKAVDPLVSAQKDYDVIFDAAAAYRWSQWRPKIKKGGAYVTTLPSPSFFADKFKSLASSTRAGFVNVKSKAADLELLGEWLASGLNVAIDSAIAPSELPAGLKKLESNRVQGRIVVDISRGF